MTLYYKLVDLDGLSVIHVSGTKGKGSTCAFCESILRAQGYKTGFFSSPHLVEVRERIRIDGRPISRDAFSTYFWECYKRLEATKEFHQGDMPAYFRFLTIMACHVFIKEKVDVAILEVGIGGEYDCTNIVRNPVVCGVSSLGIDHTSLLGSTLDAIAWHKGGIFKPGVPAVTVPQPEGSIHVLHDRAYEKGCPLYKTNDSIYECDWGDNKKELGIPGEKQDLNASLAVQLCDIWIKNHSKDIATRQHQYADYWDHIVPKQEYLQKAPLLKLSDATQKGLVDCQWPGRCQTIKYPGVTYYLDGAHTPRSIEVCANWFIEVSRNEAKSKVGKIVKILVFNATGDRQPESLLEHLLTCDFDVAVFCPNIASTVTANKGDQTNYMVSNQTQLSKCHQNQLAWLKLHSGSVTQEVTSSQNGCHDDDQVTSSPDHKILRQDDTLTANGAVTSNGTVTSNGAVTSNGTDISNGRVTMNGAVTTNGTITAEMEHKHSCKNNTIEHKHQVCTETFSSILEVLHWITQGKDSNLPQTPINMPTVELLHEADHIQVLCTGSLHLVGGILGLLEPTVCDK